MKKRLGLLEKPEFQAYLQSLPTNSLRVVEALNENDGSVTVFEQRQTGNQPPEKSISKEKLTKGEN